MSYFTNDQSPDLRSSQGRSLWPSKSMPALCTRRACSETGGGSAAFARVKVISVPSRTYSAAQRWFMAGFSEGLSGGPANVGPIIGGLLYSDNGAAGPIARGIGELRAKRVHCQSFVAWLGWDHSGRARKGQARS